MCTELIIALTASLITLMRRFIIKTPIFDYSFYCFTILSWVNFYYQNNTLLLINVILSFLICVISFGLWGKTMDEKGINKEENNKNIIDMPDYKIYLNGTEGIINQVYNNGSYLGTIIKDGQPTEIIIYSDDKMEIGEKFVILGMVDGKFRADKK